MHTTCGNMSKSLETPGHFLRMVYAPCLQLGQLDGDEVIQHVAASNEAETEGSGEAPLFVGGVITSPHGNDTKTTND